MHYLVMGQHQNIILAVGIGHGKGHHIMRALPEIRIQLHIFQEIVHPAHIPFEGEAQTIFLGAARHHGPCRRLLGDSHRARVAAQQHGIQMLEELDGLQVLIAAELIRNPLAGLSAVIQVQHGSHCVHAQAVHMELLDPVQGIGNQEVLHFVHLVVKYLGAPVGMLALSGIRILIQRLAVEVRQTMGVLGKMGRNPIQDDTNLLLMQVIDQIHEILRAAMAGGGRIVAGHLVTPGTVEGMLRDAHQLHMGITHLMDIIRQRVCQLPIVIIPVLIGTMGMLLPGARMHFIDGHGLFLRILLFPLLHPVLVRPTEIRDIGYFGRGSRTHLRLGCVRIRLVKQTVILRLNQIFIEAAKLYARHEHLPDS